MMTGFFRVLVLCALRQTMHASFRFALTVDYRFNVLGRQSWLRSKAWPIDRTCENVGNKAKNTGRAVCRSLASLACEASRQRVGNLARISQGAHGPADD